MSKIIKMDLRRMARSKFFIVSLITVAALNILIEIIGPVLIKLFPQTSQAAVYHLSDFICNPLGIPLLIILLYMSVVIFSYADFSGGFIKNLAGQVKNRSSLVLSKFIVIGIHNFIFLLVGSATRVLGGFAGTAFGSTVENDNMIPAALATLFIKWMLTMAVSAILLFLTTGVQNKTLATIVAVIFGTGALGLVYLGIDVALENIFKLQNFSVSDLLPDQLFSSVSVCSNTLVVNGIIAALAFSAVFLLLTLKVFKSKDIK